MLAIKKEIHNELSLSVSPPVNHQQVKEGLSKALGKKVRASDAPLLKTPKPEPTPSTKIKTHKIDPCKKTAQENEFSPKIKRERTESADQNQNNPFTYLMKKERTKEEIDFDDTFKWLVAYEPLIREKFIEKLIESAFTWIEGEDIFYPYSKDGDTDIPDRFIPHDFPNFRNKEHIYRRLLATELHKIMSKIEPMEKTKKNTQYALKAAEAIKSRHVATCDEWTDLMASHLLKHEEVSLFKLTIDVMQPRVKRSGELHSKSSHARTHVVLGVLPRQETEKMQAEIQWRNAEQCATLPTLLCAGQYYKPEYLGNNTIYVMEPFSRKHFNTATQWQEFMAHIMDTYQLLRTEYKQLSEHNAKLKVSVDFYAPTTTPPFIQPEKFLGLETKRYASNIKSEPTASHSTQNPAIEVDDYDIRKFFTTYRSHAEKLKVQVGSYLEGVRDVRKLPPPQWPELREDRASTWSHTLVRYALFKLDIMGPDILDVNLFPLLKPDSNEYYQLLKAYLEKKESTDAKALINHWNCMKLKVAVPENGVFLPTQKWNIGHIEHLRRAVNPNHPLPSKRLLKVMQVIDSNKNNDLHLMYICEYIKIHLSPDTPEEFDFKNLSQMRTIRGGLASAQIPLPEMSGTRLKKWSAEVVRKIPEHMGFKVTHSFKKSPNPITSKDLDFSNKSEDSFYQWFDKEVKKHSFGITRILGPRKYKNVMITPPRIEGIEFGDVLYKHDLVMLYAYKHGMNCAEIIEQAPPITVFKMLKMISDKKKHEELFINLLSVSALRTQCPQNYMQYIKRNHIQLPKHLAKKTHVACVGWLRNHAKVLTERGWYLPDRRALKKEAS